MNCSIYDYFASFVKVSIRNKGWTIKLTAEKAGITSNHLHKFLRRDTANGKVIGLQFDTADKLLYALESSWEDFGRWLKSTSL